LGIPEQASNTSKTHTSTGQVMMQPYRQILAQPSDVKELPYSVGNKICNDVLGLFVTAKKNQSRLRREAWRGTELKGARLPVRWLSTHGSRRICSGRCHSSIQHPN
jgi:hypothetical protein